jgi:predicted Zn-dependent peptidase
MNYQITTLANGLRVATERLAGIETVAVTVTVGTGARYESANENGLSHLLEHMAFKGTTTRSARDIAETFDNIGGQLNAYTSMEHTVYYAKLLKGDMPLAVDILADIIQNSLFDEKELAREKEVILQEIAMHRDSPDDLLIDYFDETAFPNQPLGRSILGTEELVSGYSRDAIKSYMARHYTPSNMILSAAGNVDHAHFVSLAEQYFTMPAGNIAPKASIATYAGGTKIVESDLEQLHVAMGYPAISIHDPRFYGLQIYAGILGGGMSSRLFQEVREKRGLAYSVYAMGSAYEDVGILSISAATSPEKGKELIETIQNEIAKMSEDVTDAELQRAKNQSKAELLMAREGSQAVASRIGRHLLTYGHYKPVEDIIKKFDAVSKQDVLDIGKMIHGGKPTLAALGDVGQLS